MFLIRPSLCGCLWAVGRHYYESAALALFQDLEADPENSNSILHSRARRLSLAPSTVLDWWLPFLFLLLTPKGKGRTVPLPTHTALPIYTIQKASYTSLKSSFFFKSWSMVLGFPGGARDKEPGCQCRKHETQLRSLEMATQSSIPVWRILWREESGRLPSMGSQRLRHDWSDLALR